MCLKTKWHIIFRMTAKNCGTCTNTLENISCRYVFAYLYQRKKSGGRERERGREGEREREMPMKNMHVCLRTRLREWVSEWEWERERESNLCKCCWWIDVVKIVEWSHQESYDGNGSKWFQRFSGIPSVARKKYFHTEIEGPCNFQLCKRFWHLGSMLWSQFSAIFPNFRRKNGVFIKYQCYDQFLTKFSFVFSEKRQYFRKIFRRKYFKNHNIGPWFLKI
jgi:hypothetical protein